MEREPDNQLGIIKKQERYKKLMNHLKTNNMPKMQQMKVNNKYYSISNAATGNSEASGIPDNVRKSLQNSKIDSDIITSSSNLHKIFPTIKNYGLEKPCMVTSSVKKFTDKNRPLMSPSYNYNQVPQNRKSNNSLKYNMHDIQNQKQQSDNTRSVSSKKLVHYPGISENNKPVLNNNNNVNMNCYRIFSHWRICLNNLGQLIIKGTLDDGKQVKSKPVCQRLSSSQVKSIFNHIYVLNGNLTDDKYELPDYVRGKFCNGFPDDWENVYELWKSYIAEGCPVIFRWPTRVTDSDDDLNSEITELTYCQKNQNKDNKQPQFSMNDSFESLYTDSNFRHRFKDDKNLENLKEKKTIYDIHKKQNDSEHNSAIKYSNISNSECVTNNCIQSVSSPSTSSEKTESFLHEFIREDKLKIILSNLGNKNLSPKYLDKFVELVDCLKYIVAYTSCMDYRKNNDLLTPTNEIHECQKCNNVSSFSQENKIETEIQNNIQNENAKAEEIKKNSIQMDNQVGSQFSDSEHVIENTSSNSESYMGIPKVNLNQLLATKIRRHERYRDMKRHKRSRSNNSDKQSQKNITSQKVEVGSDSCESISEYEQKSFINQSKEFKRKKLSYNTNNKQNKLRIANSINEHPFENSNVPIKMITHNKPIIKKEERVNLALKIKRLIHNGKKFPDIIKNEKTPENKKIQSYNNDNNFVILSENEKSENEEKVNDTILKHRFLTYDSEDFRNDEELQAHIKNLKNKVEKKDLKMTLSVNKKTFYSNEIYSNEPYGSKFNPKVLHTWFPYVECEDELSQKYSLKFKGKLLNEAGHILHKKFTTDSVQTRHSAALIETVNNEFFGLFGEFYNKSYVVPKELHQQCCSGCPVNIQKFIKLWIKFKPESINDKLPSSSINDVAISTSSRGRRIVRPLNYWQGERLSIKNLDIIYSPGNCKTSSVAKKSEISKNSMAIDNNNINTVTSTNNQLESNISSQKSLRKPVKRKILINTPNSSNSSSDSDKFHLKLRNRQVNKYTGEVCTIKAPASSSLKCNKEKTEQKLSRQKKLQSTNTEWIYYKDKFLNNLSDDLISIR